VWLSDPLYSACGAKNDTCFAALVAVILLLAPVPSKGSEHPSPAH
jgi:hypothetical protein